MSAFNVLVENTDSDTYMVRVSDHSFYNGADYTVTCDDSVGEWQLTDSNGNVRGWGEDEFGALFATLKNRHGAKEYDLGNVNLKNWNR